VLTFLDRFFHRPNNLPAACLMNTVHRITLVPALFLYPSSSSWRGAQGQLYLNLPNLVNLKCSKQSNRGGHRSFLHYRTVATRGERSG